MHPIWDWFKNHWQDLLTWFGLPTTGLALLSLCFDKSRKVTISIAKWLLRQTLWRVTGRTASEKENAALRQEVESIKKGRHDDQAIWKLEQAMQTMREEIGKSQNREVEGLKEELSKIKKDVERGLKPRGPDVKREIYSPEGVLWGLTGGQWTPYCGTCRGEGYYRALPPKRRPQSRDWFLKCAGGSCSFFADISGSKFEKYRVGQFDGTPDEVPGWAMDFDEDDDPVQGDLG